MKVVTRDLIEGSILSEDINGLTQKPIIPKRTVLSKKHIEVLRAFLIKEVQVEPILASGKALTLPSDIVEHSTLETSPFIITKYLDAVARFKQQFENWQSGAPVNILNLRQTFVPLVEKFLEEHHIIFELHHHVVKEEYLYHHAISVGLMSAFVAKKLGCGKGDIIQIGLAGILSDCGMSKVSSHLLVKQGSLTPKETEMVKQHTIKGYKMLQNTPAIQEGVLLAVLQHHEREDGSGYPLGITSEKIHPFSQIIAACDTFHAMTSERVYHEKSSPFKALELIKTETFGQFAHNVLKVLQDEIVNVSVGTKVKLNNQDRGEIVFIQPTSPTRPMIRLESGQIISLVDHPHLFIMDIN